MLMEVDLATSKLYVVDLSLSRVVRHSPFQFHAFAYTVCVYAHDDHYLARSKFNSLLTEMITPQIYIHTSINTYKTASCLSCIRGSLRLAPNDHCIHNGERGGYGVVIDQ